MVSLAPDVDSRSAVGKLPLAWGLALVAVAAALWGADGVFRRGLALELPAATVVFWEHVILVLVTIPALQRGIASARRLGAREWVYLILIGAGASATATALFTAAFRYGDPSTPLLLQKLQPLVAIVAARILLQERLRPRFSLFLVAGLAGAWLIAFSDPTEVAVGATKVALLAIGAAVLWGMGTVLGRHMTAHLPSQEITALRFAIGLPAAGALAVIDGGTGSLAIGFGDVDALILLALVPGLLALSIYYRGLRSTPASLATLAELAFPVSAITLNYAFFDTTLTGTQWLGVAVLSATLVTMSYTARSAGSRALGVDAPGVLRPGDADPQPASS
ncbi:MAG TPA: DMT family transporter [Acidimicrobiia bacterium]